MPTITLDGKQLQVDAGKTIIEAAREHGIDIPHFCWHPTLSVSGNCRMCLVEVEKLPKLAIACSTQIADGMVVHTANDRVVRARQAVMEFLLINHPLDCPICDEAGECKLQDYAYSHSVGVSRFEEDKVHKPKRVELGPNVMLDAERCIMCSRCVRFCDEIAGKPQLTFSQRGDHVVLTTFPGEQLDNPYSMNTIDICPVGALTSRDFRFKARVWEMSSTETVCPGCARGCNMQAWVRNNEILRQTPRYNASVNDYWMCDHGRLDTMKAVASDRRIKVPSIRTENGTREAGWDEAMSYVASELKLFRKGEIAVIGSSFATVEDNYLLRRFSEEVLSTKYLDIIDHTVPGSGDNLLLCEDKSPNTRGAVEVGMRAAEKGFGLDGIKSAIRNGHIKALLVLEEDILADQAFLPLAELLDCLVVIGSTENETTIRADAVLPSAMYAERNGTFVNITGRVQRIRPAVALIEQDRSLDGFAMSRLDKMGTQFDKWARASKRDARPAWRILVALAGAMGTKYRFATAEDVFQDVASHVPSFHGMNYRRLGNKGLDIAAHHAAAAASH
jgi:NADH-quinone oxidoreductase subunit G